MNIDELIDKIRKVSSEKNVQDLAELIHHWKTDEKNAIELKENVERYLGILGLTKKRILKKFTEYGRILEIL